MGFQALITLDLPSIDDKDRTQFYKFLNEHNWHKIESLTTAWKVSFKETTTREDAIKIIKNRLAEAKEKCEIQKVEYAIQLAQLSVIINTIN